VPDYHFSYLVGALFFFVAWMVCLILGVSDRRQSFWGALVSAPFAITSIWFIPQYWCPPSLFNLDLRYKVGIEDFLWAASVGGIGSVIGEIVLKERLAQGRAQKRKKHIEPFIVLGVLIWALHHYWPNKTIYDMIIALAVCAVLLLLRRPDLYMLMLVGALTFTILYWSLFELLLRLYPDFIAKSYNVPALLGFYVLGVPIEEVLFALSGGAVWSVAYEYLQGYRLRVRGGIRFEKV
jgi:hypothetical protein